MLCVALCSMLLKNDTRRILAVCECVRATGNSYVKLGIRLACLKRLPSIIDPAGTLYVHQQTIDRSFIAIFSPLFCCCYADHHHRNCQGKLRRQTLECRLQASAIGQLVGANMGGQYVQACRLFCLRCGRQPAEHGHCKILDWPIATAFLRRKYAIGMAYYNISAKCKSQNGNATDDADKHTHTNEQDKTIRLFIEYRIDWVYYALAYNVELVCRECNLHSLQQPREETRRDRGEMLLIYCKVCACLFTPV